MLTDKQNDSDEGEVLSLSRRAWASSLAILTAIAVVPAKVQAHVLHSLSRGSGTDRRASSTGTVYNVRDFGARGDGTGDDTAPCQRALNAAASVRGARILFPDGEYRLLKAGLSLGSNIVVDGGGTICPAGDFTAFVIRQGARDVRIERLMFDGSGVTRHEHGNLIELAGNNSAVEIRDCRLNSAPRSAIRLTRCRGVRICHNQIDSPYEHGIDVSAPAEDLWILDNVVRKPGFRYEGSGAHGKGISLAATNEVIRRANIMRNTVVDARHVSIELWSNDVEGHRCELVVLSGNDVQQTLTGPSTIGISIAGSTDVAVLGNRVEGGTIGLEIAYSRRVTFVGNLSHRSTGTGISVSRSMGGSRTPSQDLTIRDNVVFAPMSHGVEVIGEGTSGVIISGNVLEGDAAISAARGVLLNSMGENGHYIISDNIVRGFSGSGIYVVRSTDGIIKGNICRGNNTSRAPNEADIFINVESVEHQDRITMADNRGSLKRGFSSTDAVADGLLVQGGFRKLTLVVTNTPTSFAHGLGYAPSKVLVTSRGPAIVWQPAAPTQERIVLQSSTTPVSVDVYLA